MKATKTKMGLLELRKHWAQCIELARGRVPDLPYAQESARDDETLILTARVDGFAGTGHVCQIEQPWLFDRFMIEFLTKHGLFPAESKPG